MMFTHYSLLVRKITNLFKQINVNIACLSTNTVHDFMKPKTNYAVDERPNSGIHELRCAIYKCSYVRQTSLNLKHRHQEHLRYIKHNCHTPLILNNVCECGRVDNIMSLLKQVNIRRPTNEFLQQFYIQSHYYLNFLQNRMQEHKMQCTKLNLTFNYDTPAHDLDSNILLPACLSSCSTMNTSTISTCSSSSLVCTVPLLFCIVQYVGTLAFHINRP
jgi:hypothetical protein